MIHVPLERGKQLPTLLRQDIPLGPGDQNGDAVGFQLLHPAQKSLEHLLHFAGGCLLVVERVQQSEDHCRVRSDGFQKRGQPVTDGLFHLIASESARDEDLVEEFLGINAMLLSETSKRMDIESVAAVHHGNGGAARHRVSGNTEREREDQLVAIEQIHLPRRLNERLNKLL